MQVGEPSPDRDQQFQHINDTAKEYLSCGDPVISVDCKKKKTLEILKITEPNMLRFVRPLRYWIMIFRFRKTEKLRRMGFMIF